MQYCSMPPPLYLVLLLLPVAHTIPTTTSSPSPKVLTAWESFRTQGTTCGDVIDSVAQLGCLGPKNSVASGKSHTLVTKFASYHDTWSEATDEQVMSAPLYQSSCNLPVTIDITLTFVAEAFLRAKATGFVMESAESDEWVYGYIPAEYGLISTFFGTVSSFTANGSAYDPTSPTSAPREGYVNVVYDTSAGAAAWLTWANLRKLLVNVTYNGVRLKSFIDMKSPATRIMVMGMCDSEIEAVRTRVGDMKFWEFTSLSKWSVAVPVRKTTSSLIDMSVDANIAQFMPFDYWTDDISTFVSPPAEFSTFASTCNSQVQALHMQCRLPNAKSSLASHYVTNYGSGPLFSSQKLSCNLPVVVSIHAPINATQMTEMLRDGQLNVKGEFVELTTVEEGRGFAYVAVPARHGLVSSVIGGWATLNTNDTSIYNAPGTVPREHHVVLSFHESTSAYVWLAWFATYEHAYGRANDKAHFDASNVLHPDARVLVNGMCSSSIDRLKAQLGDKAAFLDFTYTSFASIVRPTGEYMLRLDGWN